MLLSEFLEIIEKEMNKSGETFYKDNKNLEYNDPPVNIGFQLKGENGASYSDYDVRYGEVFSRDDYEVIITVKEN